MTTIKYHAFPPAFDWMGEIKRTIATTGAKRVADLGAGAHPVLEAEFVESAGLSYTIFDISDEELAKVDDGYDKVVADVSAEGFGEGRKFDLVISRWVLEHIADPARLHRNVLGMLPIGGQAIHFFPTLYSLPFVINRLVPEGFSSHLLGASLGARSKFPAYYRWCRGPTRSQIARLQATGFTVETYVGFYGHPYFRRIPALDWIERRAAALLAENPVPVLTSFASVTLTKKGDPSGGGTARG